MAASLAAGVQAKATVLWSALAHTARLRELFKQFTKKVPGRPDVVEYDAREISPHLVADVLKVEPIRHLARYKNPTLIIHPEKDDAVPVSHARDFFQAAGAQVKELVIIPGADHVFSSIPWEEEVIGRSVKWFGQHL